MGICKKLSIIGIMESLAPDSPRKDMGLPSLMPSYTTPSGNMDWLVMPKMNVRNVV